MINRRPSRRLAMSWSTNHSSIYVQPTVPTTSNIFPSRYQTRHHPPFSIHHGFPRHQENEHLRRLPAHGHLSLVSAHYTHISVHTTHPVQAFYPGTLPEHYGTLSRIVVASYSSSAGFLNKFHSDSLGSIICSLSLFKTIRSIGFNFNACHHPGCSDGSVIQGRMPAHLLLGVRPMAPQGPHDWRAGVSDR